MAIVDFPVSKRVLKNTLVSDVAWIERVRLYYNPTEFDFIEHRLKYRPFVYDGHAALLISAVVFLHHQCGLSLSASRLMTDRKLSALCRATSVVPSK